MPFVLPSDPVAGATAPASWGDAVRDALNFLANRPACRLTNSTPTPLPHGVVTDLPFNTERYDTDGMHSTTTNTHRIRFNTAGLYLVVGQVTIQQNATGSRALNMDLRGPVSPAATIASVLHTAGSAGFSKRLIVSTVWKFLIGDEVSIAAFQDSGVTLNAEPADAFGYELSATWIGTGNVPT